MARKRRLGSQAKQEPSAQQPECFLASQFTVDGKPPEIFEEARNGAPGQAVRYRRAEADTVSREDTPRP